MTDIRYGKLTREEYRAMLASAGIDTKATIDRPRFASTGLYTNPDAGNIFREYTSGEVNGTAYEMFVTPYVLPLKLKATFYAVVFAIELPHDTASVYIESETQLNFNTLLGIPVLGGMSGVERISLEGDFDRYFNVYAQDGHEVDAVTTMAPNLMMQLLESGADFDIEFAGKNVYLYKTLGPRYEYRGPSGSRTILDIHSAYEQLHEFGVSTAKQLARFARSTRTPSPSRQPLWQVMHAKKVENNKFQTKWLIYLTLIGVALVLLGISWLFAVTAYVAYRYWLWHRRRTALLEKWRNDPGSLELHVKSN